MLSTQDPALESAAIHTRGEAQQRRSSATAQPEHKEVPSRESTKRHVINRHGQRVPLLLDRITDRLTALLAAQSAESPESSALDDAVDPASITQEIARGIPNDMSTADIDNLAAQAAHFATTRHPDYDRLASRIVATNNQKQLNQTFSQHAAELFAKGLIRREYHDYIQTHKEQLDAAIQPHRDSLFSYFGWKTLRRSYLHKVPTGKKNAKGEPVFAIHDTPQYMWMRTALEVTDVGARTPAQKQQIATHVALPPDLQNVHAGLVEAILHSNPPASKTPAEQRTATDATVTNILRRLLKPSTNDTAVFGLPPVQSVVANYHALSRMWFTHASPTLFHSLMPRNGLSSCFLLPPVADSLTVGEFSIYQFLAKCAGISAQAGGIGFNASGIRVSGRPIKGTNGTSNGLIPMLRQFNEQARYVDQGGQKRPAALAVYLEPWHGNLFEFLDMKTPEGEDKTKCADLHYGLWIPDLFMKRVESNGMWSFMSPDESPGLLDVYGEQFEELYERYEREGKFMFRKPAAKVWDAIVAAQPATGAPYMLSKCASNRKSNQQNVGVIHSSNLCTEILEITNNDETAVCNLVSISLPAMFRSVDAFPTDPEEDQECDGLFAPPVLAGLYRQMLIRTYNGETVDLLLLYKQVCRATRNLNRVIDVGFYPTPEAENSNRRHRPIGIGVQGLADVFIRLRLAFTSPEALELNEAIAATMYYAALRTSMLLAKRDGPYSTFFVNGGCPLAKGQFQFDMWDKNGATKTLPWDWESLRQDVMRYGVRNSLLIAPMPTAGTSQLLDNNEAFYPVLHVYYTRNTQAGRFPIFQKQLLRDLIAIGKWDVKMKQRIIHGGGSIQKIEGLPHWMYDVYRTWDEQPRRLLLESCHARARYTDQGMSNNIRMPVGPDILQRLTNYYFACWRLGMKNWSYYFKSSPPAEAAQTGLSPSDFGNVMMQTSSSSSTASGERSGKPGVLPAHAAESPALALDLPGPLGLVPSASTAHSGPDNEDWTSVIDSAVHAAPQESEQDGDDLQRLTANMDLVRACAEDDMGHEAGPESSTGPERSSSAPECTFACGS